MQVRQTQQRASTMTNEAVISPLERWQIPALMSMSAELMAASKYTQPFDLAYAEKLALDTLDVDTFQIWMAWRWADSLAKPMPYGMIIGSVSPMLFSPQLMAVEETIYVRRKTPFRGLVANQLMQTLIDWAFNTHKAAFLRAGETSGIEPKATGHFMRRNDLKLSGTLYHMENVR